MTKRIILHPACSVTQTSSTKLIADSSVFAFITSVFVCRVPSTVASTHMVPQVYQSLRNTYAVTSVQKPYAPRT